MDPMDLVLIWRAQNRLWYSSELVVHAWSTRTLLKANYNFHPGDFASNGSLASKTKDRVVESHQSKKTKQGDMITRLLILDVQKNAWNKK